MFDQEAFNMAIRTLLHFYNEFPLWREILKLAIGIALKDNKLGKIIYWQKEYTLIIKLKEGENRGILDKVFSLLNQSNGERTEGQVRLKKIRVSKFNFIF
jgi:hypothetical protein